MSEWDTQYYEDEGGDDPVALCANCENVLSDDELLHWHGESGRLYCSEECMRESSDAPQEG